MTRETKIKAEERFPISGQGYTIGKLLDDTECQILLDAGASKSYMSKSYYLRCKTLHALLKLCQAHKEYRWKMDNMWVCYS